jgi:RNA polymerase sigma-70 factor, ECF subfamily
LAYSEESLARKLLDNDPAAVGRVIRWIAGVLTSPRFWSLREDWRDLLQEVMLRVVDSLRHERFDASRDFRLYVQGVARFTALQSITRQMQDRSARIPPDVAQRSAPGAEEAMLGRQQVRRVLDLASEECRDLIRLYFFAGSSYSEIGEVMDLPVGTVKSRLFRCLESAHRILAGRREHRAMRERD